MQGLSLSTYVYFYIWCLTNWCEKGALSRFNEILKVFTWRRLVFLYEPSMSNITRNFEVYEVATAEWRVCLEPELILKILSHTNAIKPAAFAGRTMTHSLIHFNDDYYDNVANGPDVTHPYHSHYCYSTLDKSPVFTLVAITWVNHCTYFVWCLQ